MSWYTYFYPPKEDISPKGDFHYIDLQKIERELKLYMIDAYYTHEIVKVEETINWFISAYYQNTVEDFHNIWSDEIAEYGQIGFNHLNIHSVEEAENRIKQCKAIISDNIDDLLILTRIKCSEDESDYLRNTYICEINKILDTIKEEIVDQIKYEFVVKYYNTKKEEDEEV